MSRSFETSVAQIGLRDFLFYVIPGAISLVGLAGLFGLELGRLQPYLGLNSSLVAILLSYILGQCLYPLAYVVRRLLQRTAALRDLTGEDSPEFLSSYQQCAEARPTFFAVEVFRYRTMARFCSLMISPLLITGLLVVFGRWDLDLVLELVLAVAVALACLGFCVRYVVYEKRYRQPLQECGQSGAEQPSPT